MFVDIYSLGRGEVSSTEQGCCFTINHLQVLRGYRYVKVPECVRAVACGPLGSWRPGDPDPKLEIVYHHEAPVVYPKLPERWRTPQIQTSGTARVLVPVTNPLERALYPKHAEDPHTLAMLPSPEAPRRVDLSELLPGLVTRIRAPGLTGGPRPGPEPAKGEPEISARPPQDITERPPAVRPIATPSEVLVAAEAASGGCQGKTGAGAPCPRQARPGSSYCGAHGRKAVAT